MKLSLSFFTAAAALMTGISAQNTQQCQGPLRARRDITSLSSGEIAQMRSTLTNMNRLGWWSWFSFIHGKFYSLLHDTPQFLPWHRRYTREVELTIQYYQPSFTMPYFDAAAVCSNPGRSPVFTDAYFGGNGRSGDGCITNGMANGWTMLFPNNRCLTRNFNGSNQGNSIGNWPCTENVASDIQRARNYADISSSIEFGLHAYVHNFIGGDMSGPYSPNDFIFFLHHSNIDRIWLMYQNTHLSNKYDYSEKNGTPRDINSMMTLFSEPIIDSFDVGYGFNCYAYQDTAPVLRNGNSAQVAKRSDMAINKRDDMVSDSGSVQTVLSVPQMNLTSVLSPDVLSKFFPALSSGKPSGSTALPNAVTTKAVDFANKFKQAIRPQTVALPTNSTAASPSNSTKEAIIPVTAVTLDAEIIAPADVPQDLKFPVMDRLSDDFIAMMLYDKAAVDAYYQTQVDLANALNAAGYVSPYI